MYQKLNDAYVKDGGYGSNFDAAWRSIAASNPDAFSEYQYQFTKEKYYDTSVRKIKENLGFDVEKRSYALKSVIWSRGVQMNECAVIFGRAVEGMDLTTATDEEIIRAIYKENAKLTSTPPKGSSIRISAADGDKYGITGKYLYYFSTNASDVQAGVYNRLTNTELNEALRLLEMYG